MYDSDYSGDFVDWGTLAIRNGGNTPNSGWRTLSKEEWTYLFDTRTVNGGTGSGHSYTVGQSVNGKLGIVIYPDGYASSVYEGSDWATFEAAGCVFLPAAGYRYGETVTKAGVEGEYCSSSPNGDLEAYCISVSSASNGPTFRYYGHSVRLVRDVE